MVLRPWSFALFWEAVAAEDFAHGVYCLDDDFADCTSQDSGSLRVRD
jgi:hypothetical protein